MPTAPDSSALPARAPAAPRNDGQRRAEPSAAVRRTFVPARLRTLPAGPERRARPSLTNVPTVIARCDGELRLGYVNVACLGGFGVNAEGMVGRRLPELLDADAMASLRPFLDGALAGQLQEHELRLSLPDTGEHCLHLVYIPDCDQSGTVCGVTVTFVDTSRLRRVEDQLRRHELEFKTLVENSPDVISRVDRALRHLYVNPAIEPAFGRPRASYTGRCLGELGFPAAMVHAWERAAAEAIASGAEQRCHYELDVDGATRSFSTRLVPEPDGDGGIGSLLCITYDVTERRRMEREREELLTRERSARIQAETAARARDEFLAIVSHELRAPLNGIQSWAHVLENYVKDVSAAPLAQRALLGIRNGVAQQVRLIEDLLDVTRMMSGKLRLVKQSVALLPILQAAVESVRAMADARQVALSCAFTLTGERIDADADRLQQVVWNLLSNAVKFTHEGGHAWIEASAQGKEAVITVRDDGIGVAPDFLPHLFDRFSQGDTSSTRSHNGLGLGLFLARHLIEMHGGSIAAASEGEGRGTVFTVRLPLRRDPDSYPDTVPAGAGAREATASLAGLRVLVVDDQEEARESIGIVLQNAGARVFSAGSADEVLAWLSTLGMAEMPDALVCDIAMPGEDGYTVLRRIREWKTSGGFAPLQRLPALALTAFSQREDRIRALTAGFQMHVSKPVEPEELIVVLATLAMRA